MGQVILKKRLFTEYCLLIFVVLWSGGSFTYGTFIGWPYVMTVVAGIIAFQRGIKIGIHTWLVIGLFTMVTFAQMLVFGGGLTSIAAPILTIVSIALIANIVRLNFSYVFVRIVAFFALISLVFWLIDLIPEGHYRLLLIAKRLPQFGAANFEKMDESSWANFQRYTLYFYNVAESEEELYRWVRNSGPFFEPGRFTIVLTTAMAIMLFNKEVKKNKSLFYVILLANITTFSTTGYYAMLVLFVCLILSYYRHHPIKAIISSSLIIIVAYYILQTDFMSDKVVTALESTDKSNSRFGAMLYHWSQIVRSPLIGYGNYLSYAFGETELSPCGITEMMRRWGIPLFVLCVCQIYRSAKTLLRNDRFFGISFTLIMLVLAYSQTIMSAPFFYLLYLLGGKTILNNDGKKI